MLILGKALGFSGVKSAVSQGFVVSGVTLRVPSNSLKRSLSHRHLAKSVTLSAVHLREKPTPTRERVFLFLDVAELSDHEILQTESLS